MSSQEKEKALIELLKENADLDLLSTSDAVKVVKKWLEQKRQKLVNKPTQRTYTKECYLHVYNELLRELK